MKYKVFDNGKPAIVPFEGWSVCEFDTLEDARIYANDWLGSFTGVAEHLLPDIPVDYTGYGDTIEIRTIMV